MRRSSVCVKRRHIASGWLRLKVNCFARMLSARSAPASLLAYHVTSALPNSTKPISDDYTLWLDGKATKPELVGDRMCRL